MSDIIAIIIKGGLVMIPLLLCSVIALAVTIERFLYWRQISSKKPVEQMLLSVEQGKFSEALAQGEDSPLPAARVLAAGLVHRDPSYSKGMKVAVTTHGKNQEPSDASFVRCEKVVEHYVLSREQLAPKLFLLVSQPFQPPV